MSQPEPPPMVAPDAAKLQEIAHLVMVTTRALRWYQQRREAKDRDGQRQAARRWQAGKDELSRKSGRDLSGEDVPRPLDDQTFQRASQKAAGLPDDREINQPVSLEEFGRSTWAVTGQARGHGQIGIELPDRSTAEAMHEYMQTCPLDELADLTVTDGPMRLDRRDRDPYLLRTEYPSMISAMRADSADDRALADSLRESGPLSGQIHQKFGPQTPSEPQPGQPAEAAAVSTSNGAQALGETVRLPGGSSITAIDTSEALNYYRKPDPSRTLEFRDANGAPASLSELKGDEGAAFVRQQLDPGNQTHRDIAVEMWGNRDASVRAALAEHFPGLQTAMQEYERRGRATQAAQSAGADFDADLAQYAEQDKGQAARGESVPADGQSGSGQAEAQQQVRDQRITVVRSTQRQASGPSADAQNAAASASVGLTPTGSAQEAKQAQTKTAAQQGGQSAQQKPPQQPQPKQRPQQRGQ